MTEFRIHSNPARPILAITPRPPAAKRRIPRFTPPMRAPMPAASAAAAAAPVKPNGASPSNGRMQFTTPMRPPTATASIQPPPVIPPAPPKSYAPVREDRQPTFKPLNPPRQQPNLHSLLPSLKGLPQQTALLGVCDDQLPVLMDLADPASGALLVVSEDSSRRTSLLRTLIRSAAALNSPRSVQFLIFSTRVEEWQTWLEHSQAMRHCLGVVDLQNGGPDRWLLKLAGWADQRRTGTSTGPAVLALVDDMSAVPQLEYGARVNFDWLVKEGPAVRIWPVACLGAESAVTLARWVRLFKTRILGYASDPAAYRAAAAFNDLDANLVEPDQFAVRLQNDWLKFRLISEK